MLNKIVERAHLRYAIDNLLLGNTAGLIELIDAAKSAQIKFDDLLEIFGESIVSLAINNGRKDIH